MRLKYCPLYIRVKKIAREEVNADYQHLVPLLYVLFDHSMLSFNNHDGCSHTMLHTLSITFSLIESCYPFTPQH